MCRRAVVCVQKHTALCDVMPLSDLYKISSQFNNFNQHKLLRQIEALHSKASHNFPQ